MENWLVRGLWRIIRMQKELFVKALENPEEELLLLTVDSNPRKRFISLSHPTNSKIVYYVNFNGGQLILGLNEKKILTSIELNIHKNNWTIINSYIAKVPSPTNKLLQFPQIEIRANINELPINVYTNETNSFVSITIDDSEEVNSSWIPISKQCYVGVKDNYLQGFWIILS
jgi:hypothetical protein